MKISMENIKEKYARLRSEITHGCITLWTGKTIPSRVIMNCDNADWSHVEIVSMSQEGRLLVQGANLDGVDPTYFSHRLKYHTNFLVLQPLASMAEINAAMYAAFSKTDEGKVGYDFKNGIKELVNRKLKQYGVNVNLQIEETENTACSVIAAPYAVQLGMVKSVFFSKLKFPFPQDYLRYIESSNVKIIS